MSRPTSINDIEPNPVTIAEVHLDAISTDPVFLKGYTDLLTAMTRGGAEIENRYNRVTITRAQTPAELLAQLKSAQSSWDHDQSVYSRWAAGETLDHEYLVSTAKRHAQREGLPLFPWEAEGKSEADLDSTLADIESLTASA